MNIYLELFIFILLPTTTRLVCSELTTSIKTTEADQTTSSSFPYTRCGNDSNYAPYGEINSPNFPSYYNNNLDCYYSTYGYHESAFVLVFLWLDIEPNYDRLEISCATNSSFYPVTVRGSLGSPIPSPLEIPWCSEARIHFVAGHSTQQHTGFSLQYYVSSAGCGKTLFIGPCGQVSSPNYPSKYSINQTCSYILWADQQSNFDINLRYVYMENCHNCACDWVGIGCQDKLPFEPMRFCGYGYMPPYEFISNCRQVLIYFYSDYKSTYNDKGFNITYESRPSQGHLERRPLLHGITAAAVLAVVGVYHLE